MKANSTRKLLGRVLPYRRPVIVLIHVALVTMSYLLAFLHRFDFHVPPDEWDRFLKTLPFLLLIRLGAFAWFQLYGGLWRYVSMRDILAILKAVTLGSLVFFAGVLMFFSPGFPRSVFLLDWMMCLALVGGVRLAIRASRESGRTVIATHAVRHRTWRMYHT